MNMKTTKILTALLLVALVLSFAACSSRKRTEAT